MNIPGLVIGTIIFVFCIGLTLFLPDILPDISAAAKNLLRIVLIMIAVAAPFIGVSD